MSLLEQEQLTTTLVGTNKEAALGRVSNGCECLIDGDEILQRDSGIGSSMRKSENGFGNEAYAPSLGRSDGREF